MDKDLKIILIAFIIMSFFVGIFSYSQIQSRKIMLEAKFNLWSCVKEGDILMQYTRHSPDLITDNLLEAGYLIRNKTQLALTKESICN